MLEVSFVVDWVPPGVINPVNRELAVDVSVLTVSSGFEDSGFGENKLVRNELPAPESLPVGLLESSDLVSFGSDAEIGLEAKSELADVSGSGDVSFVPESLEFPN